ncbi:hypothetical protein PR202_ga23393 [Eleusine coracana subsp. coracana]|uniref:RING-type domain-containing protein n=1 Tax=Eleusine coracana subsp. coracana TaxID=191504 RepID=A0AAV5D536_ELECO|nr:hypothetical protein PR202_ga23393 [Eleusine coracana subsp. coracana]
MEFFLPDNVGVTLPETLAKLRGAYFSGVGYEYMHIPDREKREWRRDRIQSSASSNPESNAGTGELYLQQGVSCDRPIITQGDDEEEATTSIADLPAKFTLPSDISRASQTAVSGEPSAAGMPSSYAAAAASAAGSSSRKTNRSATPASSATARPSPPVPAPPVTKPTVASDSDPSSYSSSSGDEAGLTGCDSATASVVSAYLSVAGEGADLSKVGIFLSSAARRRSPPCLICFDPIRPSDPVWSCSSSCFAVLHLPCIQSWAHQSATAAPSPTWGCPKCRFPYPKSQTPTSYLCFCSKTLDPTPDPWILPHSCGDVCGRRLNANPDSGCEHTCLLLCHPGPCSPCPAVVPNAPCFCGAHREPRRCAHQRYSCGGKCSKRLSCGLHQCLVDCHDGPCPPCAVRGNHRCAMLPRIDM